MNKEPYLVSVLVPVFGVEQYIERCAVSLFQQTYSNIEFIFIDDCSKDGSIDILNTVIKRFPERGAAVKIICHDENRGLGAARNTAVNMATGKFLMHVDSDDWIEPDTVRLCVEKQIETNADYVLMDSVQLHPTWKVTNRIPDCHTGQELTIAMMTCKCVWNIWGALIRHSLYLDNNIKVEENVNMSEDMQVALRLAYLSDHVARIDKILYNYDCTRENQYTHVFSVHNHQQILRTLRVLEDFFSVNPIIGENLFALKAYITANSIKDISKVSGKEFDRYYEQVILKELDSIPHRYWKYVNMADRLLLYFRKRSINRLYVNIAGKIKHTFVSERK